MSSKLHVKKDDTVLIISGDERGNTGKVIEVSPKEGKVIVEGRNKVKKHVKPRKMGDPSASLRPRAPCTCPKSRSFAPLAKSRPASATKNSPTVPNSVSANAAAKRCKEGK